MVVIGGVCFAVGMGAVALVATLLERGGLSKFFGFCLLTVAVVLFLNWQLPYWIK